MGLIFELSKPNHFDFSKVFDSVPHHRLLHDQTGILWHLWEVVNVDRILPDYWSQVFHPRTLFFVMYVHDIGSQVKSTIKLFADDYREILSSKDQEMFQQALTTPYQWSQKWQLKLNVKCWRNQTAISLLSHSIIYSPIQIVDSYKYLGVKITSKVSWNKYVADV